MHSYAAVRLVPADPVEVSGAVAALVATHWGAVGRVLVDDGLVRTDAIAASAGEEAADVWLTWQLTPAAGSTLVRLVLDEVEAGPDPTDDLVALLGELAESLASV